MDEYNKFGYQGGEESLPYQQLQQPDYNQQQGYQQQPYQQYEIDPEEKTANNYAITSLVLGIVSIFCLGVVTGIPGLVFGLLSISKKKNENGKAIAGIVLSAIGILAALIFAVWFLVVFFKAFFGGSGYHTYY